MLQGVFAGAYIGFGGVLAITVGGSVQGLKDGQNLGLAQWIFGAVFPFGTCNASISTEMQDFGSEA